MNSSVKITSKLVKSPWKADAAVTKFSTCDQTSCAIATSRATFWKASFDENRLEKCLELVLEDLPFLGGRLTPLKLPIGWKMGDLQISNNNEGLEFIVARAPATTLAAVGPDTWPMRNVTISDPRVPFYIPTMDTGKKLLSGKEPLCKVQLTQLADGAVLAITVSHTITDGMHWPQLVGHIAARYRQVATGAPAPAQELIPSDGNRGVLSVETMKAALPGVTDWEPEPFKIKPSFADYFRAAGLLWGNAAAKIQLEILFVPRQRVADLKSAVLAGGKTTEGALAVTSGDIVQALTAMAVHAGEGKPLLPLRPKVMVSLVQVPGAQHDYFGNAVHPLAVGLPEGAALPAEGDYLGSLRALARELRTAAAAVRSTPAKALQALYESTQVCEAPVHKALAYLAGHRLPFVTCTTNYIGTLPGDAALDFGLGAPQLGYRGMTTPLARSMAVVRPAMAPYGEGLFLAVSMTPAQAKRLRAHPLLPALVPDAVFLGGGGSAVGAVAN